MKVKYNLLTGLCMLIFIQISTTSYAQEQEDKNDKRLDQLSLEQKQLLKEQLQLLDDTRAIFKENLSPEQRAFLNDKDISKERKTRLLRKSLSDKQRQLITANRVKIRSKKDLFRKSLTQNQKFRLKKLVHHRKLNDRKRLARRLRRLIQDNID